MSTALLVEDSVTEAQTLTRYLQQAGFTVVSATSCEEAKVQMTLGRPDLIILDVILPGQSGFELCRELKTDGETKAIPIVICSTKNTDVDRLWGNMLGADAYCTKPVDQQEFQGIIRELTQA
jgi:two-component system, chemotaxis family, response regulator PixH